MFQLNYKENAGVKVTSIQFKEYEDKVEHPVVSVIIPTFNRAEFLYKTVENFLNQSYKNFELIIVDDGSTDSTKEVVKGFDQTRVKYFYIPHSERAAARNYGALQASGKYLNFFDSDDIALAHHIETAAEIIQQQPDILAFQLHVANQFDKKIVSIHQPNVSTINGNILRGTYCFPNGMFILRETFLNYKYNESLKLSGTEDWELYLRMLSKVNISFFPIVTSIYVNHDSRSVLQFDEEKLKNRLDELILGIQQSPEFLSKYRGKLKWIKGRMLSYISLHAVLAGNKRVSVKYFKRALVTSPFEIFSKRSFAICKRIVFDSL